jgi:uncharacterized protein YjbI with pentapeptide repeats
LKPSRHLGNGSGSCLAFLLLLAASLTSVAIAHAAVAVAPPCSADWKGVAPPPDSIRNGTLKAPCYANLAGYDLRCASLGQANFTGANLTGANLTGASTFQADFSDTTLRFARLPWLNYSSAYFSERHDHEKSPAIARGGVKFVRANLTGANLTGSVLFETDLGVVDSLNGTNLNRAYFEPKANPPAARLARARNLHAMRYESWPGSLSTIREDFKRAGLIDQEREITFALRRTRALRAWYRLEPFNGELAARLASLRSCPEQETVDYLSRPSDALTFSISSVGNKIESLFSLAAFDLTSGYGLYPGRPLRILGVLVGAFMVPYLIALNRYGGGGIWAVLLTDRLRRHTVKGNPMVRVTVRALAAQPERALLAGGWRLTFLVRIGLRVLWAAFYFSLLSTFAIGWRELNVGTWLSRIQSREYTLRGSGWVRTVSGLQSVISVYLVALWVFTYFGRPFE